MKPHTLRTIADEMARDKRTTQLWYQRAKNEHGELGELVDGTRYFSDSEREILISYAGEKPQSKQEAIRPEVMPENFFQTSALAPVETREIVLPEGFDPSVMVKFFDGVTGQATDTGSLLAIADMALNAVEGAMDNKLQEQRQKLTQAQKDAEALKTKLAETKTNLKVKALESRILAEQQTAATQSAEDIFAQLMAMGKPQESPAPSSPQS